MPEKHRKVILDCQRKLKLYMAHRVRVVNQRKHIDQLLEDMVSQKRYDHAHFVIDFKMKFEPVYHMEMTVQHYGKRGKFTAVVNLNILWVITGFILQVSPGMAVWFTVLPITKSLLRLNDNVQKIWT